MSEQQEQNDIKDLQQSRIKMYHDFYNNVLPDRLPVDQIMSGTIVAAYGNLNLFETQFDYSRLEEPLNRLSDEIFSDVCLVPGIGPASRTPAFYQILKSQSFIMGQKGYMQHPEVVGMMDDEYDALIEDPYACIVEKVIPRQYKALSPSNPTEMAKAVHMAISSKAKDAADLGPILKKLIEKKGYYPGPPRGSGGFTAAPYDFLSDQLRSFSGISMDIRRDPKKVAEACEALYPLVFKMGFPPNPSPLGRVGMPLHMPTYMREKDFVEIWLPTFKRLLEQYAALGVRVNAFCEHDWSRYVDILTDLPAGTILKFEYGDPQRIKDKLGKKFIIGGLYPIGLLKTGTKQQCVDKMKELLDIMLPGGGYMFGFDKSPLSIYDFTVENYNAVTEFVRDYAVYPNAGEKFGTPLNSEGFRFDEKISPPLKSKLLFDWDEFKKEYPLTPDTAKSKMVSLDDEMFKFYTNLVV